MNKVTGVTGLVLATILTAGCHLETTARNGIVAGRQFIATTESQHPECEGGKTSPSVCKLIQDGIQAVNASADLLNAYCEGTPAPGAISYVQGGVCVPVKSLQDTLQTSLVNLNQIVADIKGVK